MFTSIFAKVSDNTPPQVKNVLRTIQAHTPAPVAESIKPAALGITAGVIIHYWLENSLLSATISCATALTFARYAMPNEADKREAENEIKRQARFVAARAAKDAADAKAKADAEAKAKEAAAAAALAASPNTPSGSESEGSEDESEPEVEERSLSPLRR